MIDQEIEAATPPSPGALRRLKAAFRRATGLVAGRHGRGRRPHGLHLPQDLSSHWERIIFSLLRLGGASAGNQVELFCDGDEGFEAIWDAIANAKRQIWFEMYIFEPDRVGRRTLDELARAAQRGCEVVLLYDAVGSSRLGETDLRPLRDAGASVAAFNPIWSWRRRRSLLRRDHRKIIIMDGRMAFCGGMNISEDYAGTTYGNGRFQDCLARLEGPCVIDLAAVFASSWRLATDERKRLPPRSAPQGEIVAQVLASAGVQGRRPIQRALRLTIRSAAQTCYITTPYFVPPLRLVRAINRAAERVVDVRILTAGHCDVPIVRVAAQHLYGAFLKKGVRIFELFDSTLHAKTITIDGLYSMVGSFNLDAWSDKRNLEINVAMLDGRTAAELRETFLRNVTGAEEVTPKTLKCCPWWRRVMQWAAYQLLRL